MGFGNLFQNVKRMTLKWHYDSRYLQSQTVIVPIGTQLDILVEFIVEMAEVSGGVPFA